MDITNYDRWTVAWEMIYVISSFFAPKVNPGFLKNFDSGDVPMMGQEWR